MHQSSMARMREFVDKHLASRRGVPSTILDLGSTDMNGSYRTLFDDPAWRYTGADLAPGPGVDAVLPDPYSWPFRSRSFDVVVSGQVFEHIEFPWVAMLEVHRVLRPNGLACIIAPSSGVEHRYPMDGWRYYPDGMASLATWADLITLESSTAWDDGSWTDDSSQWHDTVLIAQRPQPRAARAIVSRAKSAVLRRVTNQRATRRALYWQRQQEVLRGSGGPLEETPNARAPD